MKQNFWHAAASSVKMGKDEDSGMDGPASRLNEKRKEKSEQETHHNTADLNLNTQKSDSAATEPYEQNFCPKGSSSLENFLVQDVSDAPPTPSNESNSPLMCPSTEFISMMPQDTTDMILYVNPKVLGFDDSPGPWAAMESFINSVMDLELAAIFQQTPPVTSGFLMATRSQQRRGVASSGLSLDTYHSTTDLEQMGRPSYFFGMMTAEERAAIGWKPPLNANQWNSLRRVLSSKFVSNCTGSLTRKFRDAVGIRNALEGTSPEAGKLRPAWVGRIKKRFSLPSKWNFLKQVLPSCANRRILLTDTRGDDEGVILPLITPSLTRPLPPPIMIPVLTRRDKVWFFGNPTPEDHEPVRLKHKKEVHHQQFSKFHRKAHETRISSSELAQPETASSSV